MEQALLNQIKEIVEENYEILSIISIFNSAISLEVIGRFFSYTKISLENHINELSAKGILYKKSQDRGFVIEFYNKALKNMTYNKLSREERKKKHETAVVILENSLESGGKENREELIYHLEKCEDKNKLGKYLVENAKKMEKLKIIDKAILNYEKALELFLDSSDLNIKVELFFKIGSIYAELGNFSIALENYLNAYKFTKELNQSLQVDALNSIADMYFEKNQLEEALKYIKLSGDILDTTYHVEGYLENKRILVKIFMLKQECEKALDISINCIKICGNNHMKYKGEFHNSIGNIYINNSKIAEALENYEQAMKYYEDANYAKGIVRSLNNIGTIYGDYYQDIKTAIHYLNRVKEISQKNNMSQMETLALSNIATFSLENMDYEITLQYFKEALEKSKKSEYESTVFICYSYLSYVTFKMGNYKDAYEYYSLSEKEFEQYPIQNKVPESVYYQMGAELYYGFGDLSTSYMLLTKALDIFGNDGSTQYSDIKILLYFLDIHKADSVENVNQIIQEIKLVMNSYVIHIRKVNILYDLCILLYEKGYKEEAIIFLEENVQKNQCVIPDVVKANGLYLNGLVKKGNYRFKQLNTALELTKKTKNKILQWRVCNALGDYYLEKNSYFYAANYYFEACEIIKDSILNPLARSTFLGRSGYFFAISVYAKARPMVMLGLTFKYASFRI